MSSYKNFKLQDIVEGLPVCASILDLETSTFIYINKHLKALLKTDSSENLSTLAIFYSERHSTQLLSRMNGTRDIIISNFPFKDNTGKLLYFRTNSSFIDAGDKKLLLNIHLNLSDIENYNVQGRAFLVDGTKDITLDIFDEPSTLKFLQGNIKKVADGSHFSCCYMSVQKYDALTDESTEKGIELLKSISNHIMSTIRRSDFFGRIGENEFILIFPHAREQIVKDIMSTLESKFKIVTDGSSIDHSINYGIVEINEGDEDMTPYDVIEEAKFKLSLEQ